MTGAITADREATLSLTVLSVSGRSDDLEAVIDTGFNGYLTLPTSLVAALQLPYHSEARPTLGDGSAVTLRKYEAAVLWHGQQREIMVLEASGGPLIGMALLYGSRVVLDIVDGGPVSVEVLE